MGAAELNGVASLRTSKRFRNFCLAFIGASVIPKGLRLTASKIQLQIPEVGLRRTQLKTQVDDKQIQSRLKFSNDVQCLRY